MTDFQSNEADVLLRLASVLGYFCEKDKQGNWQIYARNHQDDWYLRQDAERWLLVINGVPQILFQSAEAIAFIQRWNNSQQSN